MQKGYRYAAINGKNLVIPVLGYSGSGQPSQTGIDNSPVGEINTTYDGFAAMWDAIGTTLAPGEWGSGSTRYKTFWTESPAAVDKHYTFEFGATMPIASSEDINAHWVVWQVLP
jgi:hypothetical protein